MADNPIVKEQVRAILNDVPFDPIFGPPQHPGVFLEEELMTPLGISQTRLASDLGVPYRRIHEIVHGKRAITAETAILLAKFFNMSPQFWLGLQAQFELDQLRGKMKAKLELVRPLSRLDLREGSNAEAAS